MLRVDCLFEHVGVVDVYDLGGHLDRLLTDEFASLLVVLEGGV